MIFHAFHGPYSLPAPRFKPITILFPEKFTVVLSAMTFVIECLGWVSVTAGNGRSVSVTAYTPGGKGCLLRNPSLLKYAVNLRGKRIRGTAAYRTRTHKPV